VKLRCKATQAGGVATLHVIHDVLLLSPVSHTVFYQTDRAEAPCFHAFVSDNWKFNKPREEKGLLSTFAAVWPPT